MPWNVTCASGHNASRKCASEPLESSLSYILLLSCDFVKKIVSVNKLGATSKGRQMP